MKKRYNKVVAYLLYNVSLCIIAYPISAIYFITQGETLLGIKYMAFGLLSGLITYLLTKYINKRTPVGERVGTWWRAWWLGLRIAFKLALCLTLILIPKMLSWHLSVPEQDLSVREPHWYDERAHVFDNTGNEYKVGRSGEYIEDKSGNWQKVYRDSNGDPYLDTESGKMYLRPQKPIE